LNNPKGAGATFNQGAVQLSASALNKLIVPGTRDFYDLIFQLGHEGGHAFDESSTGSLNVNGYGAANTATKSAQILLQQH